MGAFAVGFAEFIMMGVLTEVAATIDVSVPYAGNFISSYAIGVCAGTLILVFGRKVAPKNLLIIFMVICSVGNGLAAIATNSGFLILARFISGLPHGAYFGTATIAAQRLARPGEEARSVGIMVLGQTLANTLGVPGGTLVSEFFNWRFALAFICIWAAASAIAIWRLVPNIEKVEDAGLAGQFRFLKRPAPWIVLFGVFLGNSGIFCWWSYVSPWLTNIGGWPSELLPGLLFIAGLGMIVGSQAGGKCGDALTPGKAAAIGQSITTISLLMIFAFSFGKAASLPLMFLCSIGLFFNASPQQLAMVEVGKGGGEMIAGACVQVAYNGGNAVGAIIGQAVLDAGFAYNYPSLFGAPLAAIAILLLLTYALKFEKQYR